MQRFCARDSTLIESPQTAIGPIRSRRGAGTIRSPMRDALEGPVDRIDAAPPAEAVGAPRRAPSDRGRSITCGSSARRSFSFLALHWLGSVLTPFLVGAILAYLGTPVVDRAEARGVPRTWSTLLVILFIGVLVAALFLVLIPLVQVEVMSVDAPRARLSSRSSPIASRRSCRTSSASRSRSTSNRSAHSSPRTRRKRATCRCEAPVRRQGRRRRSCCRC